MGVGEEARERGAEQLGEDRRQSMLWRFVVRQSSYGRHVLLARMLRYGFDARCGHWVVCFNVGRAGEVSRNICTGPRDVDNPETDIGAAHGISTSADAFAGAWLIPIPAPALPPLPSLPPTLGPQRRRRCPRPRAFPQRPRQTSTPTRHRRDTDPMTLPPMMVAPTPIAYRCILSGRAKSHGVVLWGPFGLGEITKCAQRCTPNADAFTVP